MFDQKTMTIVVYVIVAFICLYAFINVLYYGTDGLCRKCDEGSVENFVNGSDAKYSYCIGRCEEAITARGTASYPYLEQGLKSNEYCSTLCKSL